MTNVSGKIALVTGAASGIGRETAEALAREGARVVVCDVHEERLSDVRRTLGSACAMARTHACISAARITSSTRSPTSCPASTISNAAWRAASDRSQLVSLPLAALFRASPLCQRPPPPPMMIP